MKNLFIFLLILLIAAPGAMSQEGKGKHNGHKRLQELEKIKLLEVLEMDESTTLKFFARRDVHRNKMSEMQTQLKEVADKIDRGIENGKEDLKKLNKEYLEIESAMVDEREKFINSLSDILSEKQIGKLLLFEKKFKEEIKKILFKERKQQK